MSSTSSLPVIIILFDVRVLSGTQWQAGRQQSAIFLSLSCLHIKRYNQKNASDFIAFKSEKYPADGIKNLTM